MALGRDAGRGASDERVDVHFVRAVSRAKATDFQAAAAAVRYLQGLAALPLGTERSIARQVHRIS